MLVECSHTRGLSDIRVAYGGHVSATWTFGARNEGKTHLLVSSDARAVLDVCYTMQRENGHSKKIHMKC
jgi:hypothetical protein